MPNYFNATFSYQYFLIANMLGYIPGTMLFSSKTNKYRLWLVSVRYEIIIKRISSKHRLETRESYSDVVQESARPSLKYANECPFFFFFPYSSTGFPQLYLYMFTQRKKVLAPAVKDKKSS